MAVRRRLRKGRCFGTLLILGCIIALSVQLVRCTGSTGDSGEPQETVPVTEALTESSTKAAAETEAETSAETAGETETIPETETETTEETRNYSVSKNLSWDGSELYIRIGRQKEVPIKIMNMAIERSQITWSVSDESIASVDSSGMVTALQKGECTVTASWGEDSVSVPVTVRELVVVDGCTFVDGILVANKTYDLPQDYDPGMLEVTQKAFEKMQADAAAENYDLYIGSGYRDYQSQVESYASMVAGYSQEYADAYSARPGHSEHQTGYTIDCNTVDNDFVEEGVGQWVAAHCAEYGFIIRYPEDKEDITGYGYESWHLRYVGVEAATEIMEQGLCLEEYLDIDSEYKD